MTRHTFFSTILLLSFLAAAPCLAALSLDGASAPLWSACTGWVTQAPAKYAVANENGALVFSAEGAGTEMPWITKLDGTGLSGDERYLLVRYRARGMSTKPGIYFLHGEEGTRGGLPYAMAGDVLPDDQWHTLAVDLLAVQPLETTHYIAIKVFVDQSAGARLEISRLSFEDTLPAEATVAPVPLRRALASVQTSWQKAPPEPRTGWTTSPASDFATTPEGEALRFTVRGQGKGMRWLAALPEPVNLGAMPYMSLRYQASGAVGPTTYAIWLGDKAEGTGGSSVVAFPASDLKADGAWHNVTVKLQKAFTATHLAVGLDSEGEQAEMTLSSVTFSSQTPQWSLQEVLPYEARRPAGPPAGTGAPGERAPEDRRIYAPQVLDIKGGRPSSFLSMRLRLKDWFSASDVTIGGVPFTVPTDPTKAVQTSTVEFDTLTIPLASGVREVYLLTAAMTPPDEPWGIEWQNPKPIEMLDVPEKVYYEIKYAEGPSDLVLPLDVASRAWGMKRGLSVNVVHPDATRRATELVLHDRMQTASFAVVGVTMLSDNPRVAEPTWEAMAYPAPPAGALKGAKVAGVALGERSYSGPVVGAGALVASFDTERGLSWKDLLIGGLHGELSCAAGPVFEVEVAGKVLPAEDWAVTKTEMVERGQRFTLQNKAAGLGAVVECVPGTAHELLLRMSLTNEGATATTATLRFPILRGVRLGEAADTWYLCGKRGGIINSVPVTFREPLGEKHPLQMDGFFNPKTGLALACLTHDTEAKHHFINFAKNEQGGAWSPEYVRRDLAPGEAFAATEAALVLREGDWRAIFGAYTDWLKTWFKPVAPRKPWFERVFALSSGNGHYDASPDPKVRGNVQRLADTMMKYIGVCDYVHVFGWGASKQYGDWGDYDHYEEVGGLDYFRGNIQKLQQQGIAVSLYLDGYLNSDKGQISGAHAKEWAMQRPDGSPQYVEEYQSYNECQHMPGWREHLSKTYARVQKELAPRVMYIDEIGATDGRWSCYAKDHGHNGYEIPYAGEVAMLQGIRQAVGPEVVLYTEYPPAEVSRQYIDGSITYQALWSAPQEALAPHFIDLPRFAFPDFKQLHIIYYVTNRAGNWWLLKYPFFNGEVYRIGEPNLPGMDAPSLAFLKRAVQVQCAHREAFASANVAPLVATEVPGVFANRFMAAKENVWTLYNANGRGVHQPILRVKHVNGAQYEDAWEGRKLAPQIKDGYALVGAELGPKGVGCVVQKLP